MKKTVLSALSLSLLFVMLFALVACGGSSEYDGKYYYYENGSCNMDEYIKISGNKWSVDQDGLSMTGKCEIADGKVTLSYVIDPDDEVGSMYIMLGMGKAGDSIPMFTGTIADGKMTLNSMGETAVFYLDGKVK